jgi:SAM-dependent methyltransferase
MESNTFATRTRDALRRKWRKLRASVEKRLRPVALKSRGICPICEQESTFVARDPWLRDHFKCTRCASIPRERALMWVLQQRVSNWRELKIHESSPGGRGASKRFATECPDYIPSHFFADKPLGSTVGQYRCENLEQLTFADESIDLHITQDVLEHILRPERAIAEIARTLKPGGAHIFTVPLLNKDAPSRVRVDVKETGEVVHLQPPVYHGNPIDFEGLASHDRLGLRHPRNDCEELRPRHGNHPPRRPEQRHPG